MARKSAVQPCDRESPFEIDELFFSTTDRKGVITFGNDVFVRVSGHPRERLIGAPHNVIRHPDMPRAVFRLLWDYVLAGRSVVAYVKNMAADGAYYWVLALVTPIRGGFLSVRLKKFMRRSRKMRLRNSTSFPTRNFCAKVLPSTISCAPTAW